LSKQQTAATKTTEYRPKCTVVEKQLVYESPG